MHSSIQFKMMLWLVLACLAFLSLARAVSPAPDGGYPGQNTAEGDSALFSLTSGSYNTANGFNALFSTTAGYYNTAIGAQALFSNLGGYYNTATGLQALYSNTSGNYNSAYGVSALTSNTSGNYNTANGYNTMVNNTTGLYNTAFGTQALFSNTTGQSNTASGLQALYSNTTGIQNTANGVAALTSNTTGAQNTATGLSALENNTNGIYNAAVGFDALRNNTTGSYNAALAFALTNNTTGQQNTGIGDSALSGNTSGSFNTGLGAGAGSGLTTGNYNIHIGYFVGGSTGEANTTRIGNANQTRTFISGISGVTATSGVAVYVNSNGQLGTATSSERYKEDIKPMEKASEAILGLTPVTFRYKHELDPDGVPQFGLVAEEVAKVNPDLVAKDAEGKVYTVRYEAVNAMLLNEFLKEHRKVQGLEATVSQLTAAVAQLQKASQAPVIGQQKQEESPEITVARAQDEGRALAASLQQQSSEIQIVNEPPPGDNRR